MQTAFFAEGRSYQEFHASLRCRAEQLDISRATIDAKAGWADGYAAKVLAPTPIKAVITKLSLGLVLKTLGLRLFIVDDGGESPAGRGELPRRDARHVRMCNDSRRSKGRKKPKPAPIRTRKPATPKRGKPYLARVDT